MANLKEDLVKFVNNEKYYDENELVRLAAEPNMNYKQKIKEIDVVLSKIVMSNMKNGLIEQYFNQPVEQPAEQVKPLAQEPVTEKVHNGQSHGE